jgi:DNA polymerase-3 subunit beta
MKLSVTQENLAKALSNVSRVAATRNELAILNNILLRTDNNRLLIAATNLEIASTQYIGTKIEKPGSITVPARLITEFISSLPPETVSLEVKNDHLHITSGKFSSVINGMIADEFPELPSVDESSATVYDISADRLKHAVSQTIIASSSDATRPVLTGVLWQTYEGSLYLAATDGYRLAEKRLLETDNETSAIIPTSTLQELLRCISDEEGQIQVFFDDTQVSFRTPKVEIVSRLIDGKFPDYRQLIPTKLETEVHVLKSDFSRITKIASLFARDSGGGIKIIASKDDSLLSIHSIASELGENTSAANASVSKDGEITINSRYLSEVFGVVPHEKLTFSFDGKLAPCVLREEVKQPDYVYIIMPLKS